MIALAMRMLRYLWSMKFARFVVVGLSTACLHYGTYYVAFQLLEPRYQLSNGIGWTVALVVNFFLHKHVTYQSDGDLKREFPKFTIKKLLFLAAHAYALDYAVEQQHMHPNLAQALLIPGFGILSFIVLQKYIFRTFGS